MERLWKITGWAGALAILTAYLALSMGSVEGRQEAFTL